MILFVMGGVGPVEVEQRPYACQSYQPDQRTDDPYCCRCGQLAHEHSVCVSTGQRTAGLPKGV